jgi:hypothetical protein
MSARTEGAELSAGLAACLVVGLEGTEPTAREWAWLAAWRPAGVILFGRNVTGPAQATSLCARLRAAVPGLEVMVDHEGGPVAQMVAAAGRPPAAWALGALDDAELTRSVCLESGRRLAALGVTRVLGPVADVLEHPRNPVIGARAFGSQPALCARHVGAAVRGYRDAGLRVCVKHWPGHGGTSTDSHLSLEQQLVTGCAEPFAAGLGAGADSVMVGHLPVALGPGGEPLLATLDAAYLAATRAQLCAGGDGPLLVADDVTMGALRTPMLAAGVPAPDALASGLVDPAVLPAAWLRLLRDAGCGLLLIRGIPWRALPLPEGAPASPLVQGCGTAVEPDRPAADPAAWRAARARLWQAAAGGWADAAATVNWLDFTAGDRWGAADQRGDALFAARLGSLFAAVRRVGEPDGDAIGARLLVTSHRPLPEAVLRGRAAAAQGVAVAMGHPSLVGDLSEWLGEGWRVGQVYDCDVSDLAPESGPTPQNL